MNQLFDKVYGALVGAAIGDAMGGPVEMYSYEKIASLHGWVSGFLPYGEDFPPSAHGAWRQEAGTYTDDSRMSKMFAAAAARVGRPLTPGDVRELFARAYHAASGDLARAFLEDYYYKAMNGEQKQLFGGQPANCALMGVAAFGAVVPCAPQAAFDIAYNALFTAEGYARYGAPMAAALISAAMSPGITPMEAVQEMLKATRVFKARAEGDVFAKGGFYADFCVKNETLVRRAVDCARSAKEPQTLFPLLREAVAQQFFADAAETLAIAVCMFLFAGGDYRKTVELCVNFGRDNDSSASVGGAAAGALCGASALPAPWIDQVERLNPAPTFDSLARALCDIVRRDHARLQAVCDARAKLITE